METKIIYNVNTITEMKWDSHWKELEMRKKIGQIHTDTDTLHTDGNMGKFTCS